MTRDLPGFPDVSRETMERLECYVQLLKKWNPKINLVSRNTREELWDRHFVDSAQIFDLGTHTGTWVDLGSGGGFPGLVVAILARQYAKDLNIVLIESDQRKTAFLRTVSRETGTAVTVLADRVESVPAQHATTVSARALADLDTLLGHAELHLSPQGVGVFPKGVSWKKEVDAARARWSFELETRTSLTEPGAAVLTVKGVSRV